MRTEFISLFAKLNAMELENLTREIKETVGAEIRSKSTIPVFTVANLWNIHNMRRTRAPRRNYIS